MCWVCEHPESTKQENALSTYGECWESSTAGL